MILWKAIAGLAGCLFFFGALGALDNEEYGLAAVIVTIAVALIAVSLG